MTAAALPTTREELNRKTFETVEWLTLRFEQAQITEDEFRVALNAVWMTAAGLVDREFLTLMGDVRALIDTEGKSVKTRHFIKVGSSDTLRIRWQVGTSDVAVDRQSDGLSFGGSVISRATPKEALELMNKIAERFLREGYREL